MSFYANLEYKTKIGEPVENGGLIIAEDHFKRYIESSICKDALVNGEIPIGYIAHPCEKIYEKPIKILYDGSKLIKIGVVVSITMDKVCIKLDDSITPSHILQGLINDDFKIWMDYDFISIYRTCKVNKINYFYLAPKDNSEITVKIPRKYPTGSILEAGRPISKKSFRRYMKREDVKDKLKNGEMLLYDYNSHIYNGIEYHIFDKNRSIGKVTKIKNDYIEAKIKYHYRHLLKDKEASLCVHVSLNNNGNYTLNEILSVVMVEKGRLSNENNE